VYDADPTLAYERLHALDPAAAATVHVNDRRRVVRALELAETGSSLTPAETMLWSQETRRPTLVVGLDVSPAELERRIALRVDRMLARGAVLEATTALAGPVSRTARRALGLEELASLPLDAARARIILRTRQYAAYQRKWMRRIPGLRLIDGELPAEMVADAILDLARAG
jgi:tRNA dimethylallyltransferase